MNIDEPYYSFIVSKNKIIEGRLNKGKFKDFYIGQKIKINNKLFVEIIDIKNFSSFEEMLMVCGIDNVLPDCKTIEEGIEVYKKFYAEQDKQFGVLALYISISS